MNRRPTLPVMRSALLAGVLAWLTCAATATSQTDFGDYASSTLTAKAWDALGGGDLDSALAYANKCIEMYEAEALRMQASLSDFPPTDPPEKAHAYWALNDVGTCYFIKGEVLVKRSDLAGAQAAYNACSEKFGYCQCWDTKGWFWRPGVTARQKALELSFDAE